MPVYILASTFSLLFAYIVQYSVNRNVKVANVGYSDSKRSANNIWIGIDKKGILHINKESAKIFPYIFLSFLPLYIVSAIRYMVGTDYAGTYRAIYNYTYQDGYHFKLNGETLYGLLNRIAIIYSGSDYVGVFALSSLLICGFIFAAIKKQSPNFFYSVLLFIISGYYFWSFNAVRQMIAMAIFMYAFHYIEKGQLSKYCIFILLAAGFHKTAFLYLPLYFIKDIKVRPHILFGLSFIFISSAAFLRNLAYMVTSKIEILNVYATRYFESSRFDSYTESSPVHALISFIFLLLFIVIVKLYDPKQIKCNMWVNLQFLAFAFASLSSVLPLANRLSRLFAIMQILSIPSMTQLISKQKLRMIINTYIVICYAAYSFVTYYILGYHDVFPYQTIFAR